jgi:hypothetical protein
MKPIAIVAQIDSEAFMNIAPQGLEIIVSSPGLDVQHLQEASYVYFVISKFSLLSTEYQSTILGVVPLLKDYGALMYLCKLDDVDIPVGFEPLNSLAMM